MIVTDTRAALDRLAPLSVPVQPGADRLRGRPGTDLPAPSRPPGRVLHPVGGEPYGAGAPPESGAWRAAMVPWAPDPAAYGVAGRGAELMRLRDALAGTVRGAGGVVLVEGPAGIGKTALLAAAATLARELGLTVATAVPWASTAPGRGGPLAPLLEALRRADPPVLGAGELGALAEVSGRVLVADRLAEQIARYARVRPLLIVLDDVHLADELTAFTLRALVPALAGEPVRWLLAQGPVPAGHTAPLPADQPARRLHLRPLPAAAVRDLCQRELGAAPDPTLLAVVSRAGGNPRLVRGLLGAFRDRGEVAVRAGTAGVRTGTLPASFLAAVADGLPAPARQLLDAGAVLGRPVGDLLGPVQDALDSGALVDTGGGLAFGQDLTREAVYAAMPRAVRAALHREADRLPDAGTQSATACARSVLSAADRATTTRPAADRSTMDRSTVDRSTVDAAGPAGIDRARSRRGRPVGPVSPQTGWDSLTTAELRVVDLVAMGMRNREVAARLHLSPHTIDSHLRHAFTKLGVTSRVQLTRHAIARTRTKDQAKT